MGLRRDIYLSRKPLAGFFAIGMAWSVYFAQMPVIKANVGASDAVYGIALLIGAFGALGAMWLAPAAQRLAGGMATPLGVITVALGMLASGVSTTVVGLTLAMILASAGSGVVDVLVNARISEVEERSGRTLMNLNHGLYSFAYAGGALATGALRSAGMGPVPIFILLAVILGGLALASRDTAPDLEAPETPASAPLTMPHLLVFLAGLTVFVAFLSEAVTEGWSALHLERTLGGTAGEGALGPALMGLTMGIGRLFGHGLARFVRDTHLMLIATLLSAVGLAVAGQAGSVPVALMGFALGGLGISVVAPLALALVGRRVPPAARLVAISRVSVMGYGAFFIGPSLMGFIAQGLGLGTAFVMMAGMLALTALVLIPLLARQTRDVVNAI